jgi:hypothetical protein
MPVPTVPRVRVSLGGTIGGAAWSTAFYMSTSGAVPDAPSLQAFANAAISSFATTPGPSWADRNHSATQVNHVRADWYDAGSRASSLNVTGVHAGIVGTLSSVSAASQSMVVSLYSATQTRSGRGRMYLPATGSMSGGAQDYAFPSSSVAGILAGMKTWLIDVASVYNANVGVGATPVVQSLTTGSVHVITTLLIDTRPDRQEVREKHLSWTRQAVTTP